MKLYCTELGRAFGHKVTGEEAWEKQQEGQSMKEKKKKIGMKFFKEMQIASFSLPDLILDL